MLFFVSACLISNLAEGIFHCECELSIFYALCFFSLLSLFLDIRCRADRAGVFGKDFVLLIV